MTHEEYMRLAMSMATGLPSAVSPNPLVGCVIVKDGQIIGRGRTQPPGGNHAEIEALVDAANNGFDPMGSTVYVTLEPCPHYGLTPPCTDRLIQAGVSVVVVASTDPDPRVSGKGFTQLDDAGVQVISGILEEEARRMNVGFFSRMERARPWVRLKVAASLDGRTALLSGQSQWITSDAARHDSHLWRARADAILTGSGTVYTDDPQLTVRGVEVSSQPHRVIIDSRLRISPTSKVLTGEGAWLFCAQAEMEKVRVLSACGAQIMEAPGENGMVDLHEVMRELARRKINEVHVEAGSILNGALIRAGLVDELLIYLAPSVIGRGLPMFDMPELSGLNERSLLEFVDVSRVGEDLRIIARITAPA